MSPRTSPRPIARLSLLATSGALALLLACTLLAGSAPAATTSGPDAPTNVSSTTKGTQRIRLEVLPAIVQQGGRVASPDVARAAVVAVVRPVRAGRKVQLQVRRDSWWEAVALTRQDGRGRVQLAAPVSEDGQALTYRVKAMAAGGLRAFKSRPVSTERWLDPTWTDEFSGSHLGPEWNHRGLEHLSGSRRTCSKGDPRAVRVEGGAVRLSVITDPDATTRCRIRGRDAAPGRYAYRLSGHIGTQGSFSFKYGVAAARVKFQRRRGQHGAFWMQPVDGMHPGAAGSEIDVAEYFGDHHPRGGLATFVHRYVGMRRVSTGGWIPRSASYLRSRHDGWSRNYHVFSVEWTPRQLVYRIDGKETTRVARGVSDVRQFPVLSLIAADYEIPKIRERQLPQHMYVDWVRVWETGS
jgi:beta-glucanase (GH16 family)